MYKTETSETAILTQGVPRSPCGKPGKASAVHTGPGPRVPSLSPSSVARSAAPLLKCRPEPLYPHTYCVNDSTPYWHQPVYPEGPVGDTKNRGHMMAGQYRGGRHKYKIHMKISKTLP